MIYGFLDFWDFGCEFRLAGQLLHSAQRTVGGCKLVPYKPVGADSHIALDERDGEDNGVVGGTYRDIGGDFLNQGLVFHLLSCQRYSISTRATAR